ncbi:MAG TPA: SOS response-associated peptidase [Acidimicrobiales bacterium]|nr:SOS response-associated peptidase [Acidimicrobiales bacterium]
MCGRFVAATPTEVLAERFEVGEVLGTVAPSWNVAPTRDVHAVTGEEGRRRLEVLGWGLVPPWSRNPSAAAKLINARAETVHERPVFQPAFRSRRCLISATGVYEWRRRPGGTGRPEPFYFARPDGDVLALAGIWEAWSDPTGRPRRTCAIITGPAGPVMGAVHGRAPVVLTDEAWDDWLDPTMGSSGARLVLEAAMAAPEPWEARAVGREVNDVATDGPHLIAAPGPAPLFDPGSAR